jgi:eukaryotic-like serine/threonine-protein kinase
MKYCTACKARYDDSVSFCPVDGEALELDSSAIVGTVLDGQYQIEAMLGKGGMGAVYRARHIMLGDRVAIKILPPEMRNNAEWLRRFRREGQAARRFRHPNAVTVYDLRTASDGTIYLVMEYVEGHTLDAELKARGRFTPVEAFEVLEPIMSVLNAAHAMGVVHRDLKPENIMLGKATTGGEPVVKLLDLGIAKLREVAGLDGGGGTALTLAGQMLGTPYYMSPEQWGELPHDGNSEIDGRADIYSLGLVLYEMIAGRKPHAGLTLQELRREHVHVTPPPLDQLDPEVPKDFSETVARAMAKDRGERPATAGELAANLRTALGTLISSSPRSSRVAFGTIDQSKGDGSEQTVEVSKAALTKSDVNAPTIITLDSTPEGGPAIPIPSPPFQYPSQKPAGQQQPQATPGPERIPASAHAVAGSIAESAAVPSSVTATPAPRPVVAQPAPRRNSVFLIVGGLLFLVLIVVGVGGFLAYNWIKAKPTDNQATSGGRENGSSTVPAGTTREAARYWLEVLPASLLDTPVRVAGVVPLASGQAFKFHFVLSEDGYLYIVGPGEKNQPTAFLTIKPAPISGLESNRVSKGVDFSFPSGMEHWLELDKRPGTEDYTIIFSAVPLSSPQFLGEQTTGQPLTDAEQTELTSFLAKHKTDSVATELNDASATDPFVTIKVPPSGQSGNPIIFPIRIQHK